MIRNVIKVNLKDLLKEADKTLFKLASETGITYPTLHRIANKPVESISLGIVEKICSNLKCEIGELLVIEGEHGGQREKAGRKKKDK